jgi:hypothetical protein
VHEKDLRIRLYDIYIKIDAFPASVESDIKENRSEEKKSISICIFNTISTFSESTNLKVLPIEMAKSGVFIKARRQVCSEFRQPSILLEPYQGTVA